MIQFISSNPTKFNLIKKCAPNKLYLNICFACLKKKNNTILWLCSQYLISIRKWFPKLNNMSARGTNWKHWRVKKSKQTKKAKPKTSLVSQKNEISSNPHFNCGVFNDCLPAEHWSSYTNLLALQTSACRTSALPHCIVDKSLSHSLRCAIVLNRSVYLCFI